MRPCGVTAGHGSLPSFTLAQLKLSFPLKLVPLESLSLVLVALRHHALIFILNDDRPFGVVFDSRSKFIPFRVHVRMRRPAHFSTLLEWVPGWIRFGLAAWP